MLKLPRPCLLPYFTAGWPNPAAFEECVAAAARAGCPAFEVGIPFSDPVADGPVIQATSQQALEAGVDWNRALELTGRASRASGLPAIAMTYANLLYSRGLASACSQLAAAGCQALIVPDLTLEEGQPFEAAASQAGLDLIYLVAPTTPDLRLRQLAQRSRGFLYLVSLRGVTGARTDLPPDLGDYIDRVKRHSEVPVLVGFGISTPQQAASVAARADGAIVGSALLRAIQNGPPEEAGQITLAFLQAMVTAMARASCAS